MSLRGESGGGHDIEDEGIPILTRLVLNFVGGGVVVTDIGDKTTITIAGGGTIHDLLSATHPDVTPATVLRGSMIVGKNVSPLWELLVLGGSGTYLRSDGTDLIYSALLEVDLPTGIAVNKIIALTINRALETDASGFLIASAITNTELNRLTGVTSDIQVQLDAKELSANKDTANGYAGLDAGTLVLLAQIPNLPTSRITSGRFTFPRLPLGTAFQRYRTNAGATDPENFTEKSAIEFVIDGGGSVIAVGIKGHLRVEFDCEITRWTMLGDQSGSIELDINRYTSLANFDTGTKASITGTDPPDLVSDLGDDSVALTGWTVILNEGDILEWEVISVTTIQRVTNSLRVTKRG